MRRFYVYCHTNKVNGKKYVGITASSVDHRWKSHCQSVRKNSQHLFHRAIRKYGEDAWEHDTLDVLTTYQGALRAEQCWIEALGTYVRNGRGYNATLGGEGSLGYRPTDETIKKLRESHLGVRLSEAAKAKLRAIVIPPSARAKRSEQMRRRWAQPGERERFSASRRGHHLSEETKAKIGAAHRGKKLSPEHVEVMRQNAIRRGISPELRAKMVAGRTGRRCKPTPETLEKLRLSHLGKKLTEEQKAKIAAANRGQKRSEETRKKLSAANVGRVVSDDTRRKISASNKGKHHDAGRARSKLTEDDVRAIRAEYVPHKVTRPFLAKKYGITAYCLKAILERRTWVGIE